MNSALVVQLILEFMSLHSFYIFKDRQILSRSLSIEGSVILMTEGLVGLMKSEL